MSLRQYAFVLFSLFLVITASVQVVFIYYVQNKMSEEIRQKSQAISEQTIKLLLDETEQGEPKTWSEKVAGGVVIKIEDAPKELVKLNEDYVFQSGDETKRIEIKHIKQSAPTSVFMEKLENIKVSPLNEHLAYSINIQSPDVNRNQIIQFSSNDSVVSQYFNWLTIATIGLALVGVFFAFWLAKHLSTPLSSLAKGFHELEQGGFGTQLHPSGIGEVKQTLVRFNQMSERLAALNAIEKQFVQQQQLANLGEMTRGLAHTLRNPLNTIGLAIEQLVNHQQSEQDKRILAEQIRGKMSHLDNTIKSLLSMSTSGVERHQPNDIATIVQDIIMELSMASPVSIQYAAPSNLIFCCSAQDIRTMFQALIANAVEASEPEQTVAVFTELSGTELTMIVIDQGPGLDPQITEALFTPHSTTKAEGAGMGLFIVRQIAESYYQGKVSLTNMSPLGCKATLTLTSQENRHEA